MSNNKLIRNSFIGTTQVVLTAFLTLLSVPVFIKALGLELYGIFALVSVVGNLNFIINFGLNNALLVYVARQGKCRESDLDIAITRILLIIMVLIIGTIAFLFGNYIIRNILSVPEEYLSESKSLFYLLILSNGVLLIGQTYTAILDALQKIHITNVCQFIYSVIYWVGIIIIVKLGGRLPEVGLMVLSSSVIWFVILVIVSRRVWGKLDIRNYQDEFYRVAKKQLSYGTKIYTSGLVGFLFEPFSKILLSNFIGLNAVGLYEIGLKVKGQVVGIFNKALYPLLPYIAHNYGDRTLEVKLIDLSKKLQLFVIPVTLSLIFTLTILVKLWLGDKSFEQASVFVIALTVIVFLFSFPIIPIYQYLFVSNRAGKTILMQLSSVIINIFLFIFLYKKVGLYSIIIANLGGYLSSYSLGIYYEKKYLAVSHLDEWPYYLKLLVFSSVSLLASLCLNYFITTSLFDIIIYPFVNIGFFILFVRKMKLINQSDLDRYCGTIPWLNQKLSFLLVK